MSLARNRRNASASRTRPYDTETDAPSIMATQETWGCSTSSHANCQCVGRISRHFPSAVTESRIELTITRPTAPPTAPSGESVDTESRKARPATTSSVTRTYPSTTASRPSAAAVGSATPVAGSRSGCQPNATVPASSAITGRLTTATVEYVSATASFCLSNRARGTGAASRYRSDDQLASLATVSPQNKATATTSRKPAETKTLNAAKWRPPVVAAATRPGVPLFGDGGPPTSKAPTSIHGRTSRIPNAT